MVTCFHFKLTSDDVVTKSIVSFGSIQLLFWRKGWTVYFQKLMKDSKIVAMFGRSLLLQSDFTLSKFHGTQLWLKQTFCTKISLTNNSRAVISRSCIYDTKFEMFKTETCRLTDMLTLKISVTGKVISNSKKTASILRFLLSWEKDWVPRCYV